MVLRFFRLQQTLPERLLCLQTENRHNIEKKKDAHVYAAWICHALIFAMLSKYPCFQGD